MPITRSPLTIVHLSTELGWGGGEQQALHLAKGLRQRGHRSVIVARRSGEFAHRLRAENFEVHSFHRRGRGPDALWALRHLVRSLRPDVIHAHDGHALSAAGLATFGLRRPLRVASRRVAFPIRSSAKFRRFADVVIAISRSVMDVCRQSGIPESMLRLVYSGVDPKRAASGDRYRGRRSLRLREDEPLIVVVARLTPCKGHSCFLQALPTIRSHYPKLRVALVGDGELSATLKAETHRLGLARHVMFLGHRRDVPDLIRAADLFVMPSHVEGLCTSLLDAMFARVPIVTTGVGGIADVIDLESPQGPCSWLATPNDSSDLARVIIDGLSEKEESTRLIEQAYQRAWKNFTHQRMVAGTLAIYREWLATDCRRAA